MTSPSEPAPRGSAAGWITLLLAITLALLAVISTRAGVFNRPLCPRDPGLHPWQVLGGRKFGIHAFHRHQPWGCPPHPDTNVPARR